MTMLEKLETAVRMAKAGEYNSAIVRATGLQLIQVLEIKKRIRN